MGSLTSITGSSLSNYNAINSNSSGGGSLTAVGSGPITSNNGPSGVSTPPPPSAPETKAPPPPYNAADSFEAQRIGAKSPTDEPKVALPRPSIVEHTSTPPSVPMI